MSDWTIAELSNCHRKVWKENQNKTVDDLQIATDVARELLRRGFSWDELNAIFNREYV